MKNVVIFLSAIVFLCLSLPGGRLLIRESRKEGYMEIAAPVKGGKGQMLYLICSYPKKDNPGEEEIEAHFTNGLPFKINGVYLVGTIVPQDEYQAGMERCDLYLTLPRPKLDRKDLQQVDRDPKSAEMFPVDSKGGELISLLLTEAINEKYMNYYNRGNIPFDIKAWVDREGNAIIEKQASLGRIKYDKENLSGLLVRVDVNIPGYQGLPYVKVIGDILDYILMRKYFVKLERSVYGDYYIHPTTLIKIWENSVLAMICNKGLSCFDLPFVNGSIRFIDRINAREWRRVKGCDAFDVQAEVIRINLNPLQKLLKGKQSWEILLFLLFMAGISLFYYMQYVFLKNCGWKPMACVLSLGMSTMAFGFFYFLHYYKPFPYVPEMPLPLALAVYAFCAIAAMLYAVLQKKKKAVFAILVDVLETLVFLMVLTLLGHAGG